MTRDGPVTFKSARRKERDADIALDGPHVSATTHSVHVAGVRKAEGAARAYFGGELVATVCRGEAVARRAGVWASGVAVLFLLFELTSGLQDAVVQKAQSCRRVHRVIMRIPARRRPFPVAVRVFDARERQVVLHHICEERDYKGSHALFPSNITRDGLSIKRDYPPSLLKLQGRSLTKEVVPLEVVVQSRVPHSVSAERRQLAPIRHRLPSGLVCVPRPVVVPIVPAAIQKGTRVLISLWDSLMFGRVLKIS